MKVHIRQIRTEGIELEEMLSPEWVGLTHKDNIRLIGPIAFKAQITRVGDEMFVDITAKSRYEFFCYRCVSDIKNDWTANFILTFDIDKQIEFIDISEDVRQEIILNLPARILCMDNCKGLCMDCGVDLNTETCACAEKITKDQKIKINL